MDDIEDTNYKFNSQDIENIWYICKRCIIARFVATNFS